MATTPPLRLTPEWDDRFARMVVVSALGHLLAIAVVVLLLVRAGDRPLPMVAYTVELTDPSALGGRLPPGPPAAQLGAAEHPPSAEPKGQPPAAAKPPERKPEARAEPPPKPQEPVVRIPEKPKPPEPKPPEPKAEVPKPEPPKPEAKKPEPPKATEEKQPPTKQTPKPAEAQAKPAVPRAGTPSGTEDATPRDAYGAAAERWRARAGGGLGGTDGEGGPIGSGGAGKGGGGEVVGLEFLAYRQLVIQTIKAQWANVIARPGLVAAVRFEIASDGTVSNVRIAQSSGNPAYDASALRAVQHTSQLPAPPAKYANEFRDFLIEFHSEETGGRGAG